MIRTPKPCMILNTSNLQCLQVMEEYELPLIDISTLRMTTDEKALQHCASAVTRAATQWGFFMVVSCGIRDFMKQVKEDINRTGNKVGLQVFCL
ncbi:hypothetical protein ZIOFF_030634 [Zingiber officinale]|uniref:Non-haem dioxygenase N-terminal domain-containing protein n=1 Tax=Zingiber officinale TaxID=94328 RepID=A0A8J5GVS1_ZINOF|nr:hypothetical protein ZIOFF_030634 [Zingiber officinale]